MFLFRTKGGSSENLTSLPDKMTLDDEEFLTDENQNTDTDRNRVVGGRDDTRLREHLGSDSVQLTEKQVQSHAVGSNSRKKRVRWADHQLAMQLAISRESDESTQVSSSEEEEQENEVKDDEENDENEEEEDESDEEIEEVDEEEEGEDESSNEEDEDDEDEEDSSKPIAVDHSSSLEELDRLRAQLDQLHRDTTAKSSLIDRLHSELREAYQDAELAKYNMSHLELELEETKRNLEVKSGLDREEDDEGEVEKLDQAEQRISHLEEELKQTIMEKEQLEMNLNKLKIDREQEISDMQKAYEEALKEQDEMMAKFEEDFEELRTLNSRREQQMLEDFEWKLREVEKACKLRVEKRNVDKDREIAHLVVQLADLNAQLDEARKLEVCQVELEQMRTSNADLKRNLRTTNRKLEEVQVNEKVHQEETTRLRSLLDKEKSFSVNLQIVHREELDERNRKMNFQLESQKNTLNSEWEDRLKKDSRQLKLDMDRKAKNEISMAVEDIKKHMEDRIRNIKVEYDEKSKQLTSQIEELKKRQAEREMDHRDALENVQSRSDSELVELRRKMEKLYMSYEEKIERLNEQHEQQMNRLQEECDKRVQQMESNLHMQTGSNRATVELVKEHNARDHQARLQILETQHQKQLEEQWCRLNKDKEDSLKNQEAKHKELVRHLEQELDRLRNNCVPRQQKDSDTITIQNKDGTSEKISVLDNSADLQQTTPVDKTSSQSLRAELGEAELNLVKEKERLEELTLKAKMCQTIQQLTLQLEASKKEIESLNSRLHIRSGIPAVSEVVRPLLNDPPEPPPRSRGRHGGTPAPDKQSATLQMKSSQVILPTAKVQPQPLPTAKVQPRAMSPPKQANQHSSDIKVQANTQQPQSQSRRSRKNRSRRH